MVTIARSMFSRGCLPIMARETGLLPSIITQLKPRGMKGMGLTNLRGMMDSDKAGASTGEVTVAWVFLAC